MSHPQGNLETQGFKRGTLAPHIRRQGDVAKSIADDVETFTQVIWNHQQEQELGPIPMDELEERLGWRPDRFIKVLKLARQGKIQGVFESSPGRLAYTWSLTEEDLKFCEARVEKLRREREARH